MIYSYKHFRCNISTEFIQLNVGGTLYITTKKTLTKFKGTGQYKVTGLYEMCKDFPDVPEWLPKDQNGNYFIDADEHLFRFILNYLRTMDPETGSGPMNVPLGFREFEQLKAEARFYEILSLIKKIEEHAGKKINEPDKRSTLSQQIDEMRPKPKSAE